MSNLPTHSPFLRPAVLLDLLVDPVTLHAPLSTQIEVLVPRQGGNSPDSVASDGRLGVCSSSTLQWAFRRACSHDRDTVLLELVECDEQCAGYILQFVRQHP